LNPIEQAILETLAAEPDQPLVQASLTKQVRDVHGHSIPETLLALQRLQEDGQVTLAHTEGTAVYYTLTEKGRAAIAPN
jgi:DNA-binding PadR family transcriptional regulator